MSLLQQLQTVQPAQPVQQQKKQGIFGNLVQSVAKPFIKTAATGLSAIEGTGQLLGSLPGGVTPQELQQVNQQIDKTRNFGFLGSSAPVGQKALEQSARGETTPLQATLRGLGDVVGTGLELGSYFAPVGLGEGAIAKGGEALAKPTLGALAKGGAVAGGLGSLGSSLQENQSLGKTLANTAVGTVTGGVLGAAVPAVGRGIGKVASGVGEAVKPGLKFAESQVFGLSPETMQTIRNFSEYFGKKATKSKNIEDVTNSVEQAFKNHVENTGELGKAYGKLRKSNQKIEIPLAGEKPPSIKLKNGKTVVSTRIQQNPGGIHSVIADALKKFGLKVSKDGEILAPTSKTKFRPEDIAVLQKFIDQYGRGRTLSTSEFLNIRQALDVLAKYDTAKAGNVQNFARVLRQGYDVIGKERINGLRALDEKFAPEVSLMNEVRSRLYDKNGNLKDSIPGYLMSLGSPSNFKKLQRLEKIVPGIGDDIRILRAINDIENAGGQKVGTYLRSIILGGGGVASFMHGNFPLAILLGSASAVAAAPENIVNMIVKYGEVTNAGRAFAEKIVGKMKAGKTLTTLEKQFVRSALTRARTTAQTGAAIQASNTKQ